MALGKRIKALRKDKRMTLDQVAKKSGVAKATLSKIENGIALGTLRTHLKLCEALDVNLSDLYAGIEQGIEGDIVALEAESKEPELFTYDEKASSVILSTGVSRKHMLPQLLMLDAGGKTPLEQNPRGTEKFLFVLEGQVEAKVGERSYKLKQSSVLYFRSSLPHFFRNTSKVPAKFLCVTSPVAL